MTPARPDIDLKLDGAKEGREGGISNHRHILVSTYCSVAAPSLYKGGKEGWELR